MKKCKVSYATDAAYDLLSISLGIISEYGDPVGAKRTTDRIIAKCNVLSLAPEISPVKMIIKNKRIRFIHSGKFTIIYTFNKSKSEVIVYRIVSSRMDLVKLLKSTQL